MNWNYVYFLSVPILSCGIVLLLQCVLNRGFKKSGAQALTMLSMVLGYPFFFVAIAFIPFDMRRDFGFYVYLFLLYSFSAYTYFHIFNMGETSRRIRMVLFLSGEKARTEKDLATLFDEEAMLGARLNRLVALRQARFEDGRYSLSGKFFLRTAQLFWGFSALFGAPWKSVATARQGKLPQ